MFYKPLLKDYFKLKKMKEFLWFFKENLEEFYFEEGFLVRKRFVLSHFLLFSIDFEWEIH